MGDPVTVLYSPDGHWSITAVPGKYNVDYDGHPTLTFTSVGQLEEWLAVFGVYLADLQEDHTPPA